MQLIGNCQLLIGNKVRPVATKPYAIENINQWTGCGMDFNTNFLYLSKSMGHSVFESTKYYYSLVPGLADIIQENTNMSFEAIIPDINNKNDEKTE